MATPNVNSYNTYIGNGVATEFSIGFGYTSTDSVKVYIKRVGGEEALVNTADYSFVNETTLKFPAVGSSETILAEGDVLTIQRETPVQNDFVFSNQKRLFPEDVMEADDNEMRILQEHERQLGRALVLQPTSQADPEVVIGQVERVYESIDNVDAVADNIQNVNTVAEDKANVDTVAGAKANVDTVAGSIENVNAVGGSIANVNTVAGSIENVNAVAGNAANINAVASNSENINQVAADSTAINDCHDNMAAIQAAPDNASAAATSAEHARIWAEGDDDEVEELGGTHSSLGSAGLSYAYANSPFGTSVEEFAADHDVVVNGEKGDKGDPGTPGTPGTPGAAATISVGTVTTGAAGSSATVTNSGTSSAAVFDFTIPKGDKGDQGNPGSDAEVTEQNIASALGYVPQAPSVIESIDATDSITIADNTVYKGGTQTALTVVVPSSGMDVDFISQICFKSGSTATTFTQTAGDIVWDERSVDLTGGVFVPVSNKTYTIIIFYNGFDFVGLAEGVENAS